jgi:hypothetical protein
MLTNHAAILLTALCLGACLEPAASQDMPQLVPRRLAEPPPERLGEAQVLGVFELKAPVRDFTSLSGMHFDGRAVTALTDRGHWLRFHLEVDGEGRPVSAGGLEMGRLVGLDGSKSDGDAEELAWTPEGWLVSFERRHRVMLYADGLAAKPRPLAMPQGFSRQPGNGGVEALTRLADGRFLMLSEQGVNSDDTGWAWVGRPGKWESLRYGRTGLFRPTGAVTLPDGDVLVTERRFTWLGGMALRLVRLPAAAIRPGALLEGRQVFVLEPPLLVDNFEAVSVHARADGRVVAYILSDDNRSPLQSTLLLAVLLPD